VQAEGFSIEVLSRKRRSLSSTDACDVDECARKICSPTSAFFSLTMKAFLSLKPAYSPSSYSQKGAC
jgi:hypothetical protein